jgi:hypothetical protein
VCVYELLKPQTKVAYFDQISNKLEARKMHKYGTILAIMLIGLSMAVSIGSAVDEDEENYNAAEDAAINNAGTACGPRIADSDEVSLLAADVCVATGSDDCKPKQLCKDTPVSGYLYAGESITLKASPCKEDMYDYQWVQFIGKQTAIGDTDCDWVLTVPVDANPGKKVGAQVTIWNQNHPACMDDECIKFQVKALPCCPDLKNFCEEKADQAVLNKFAYSLGAGYTTKWVIDGDEKDSIDLDFLNGLAVGKHTASINLYKDGSETPFRTEVCAQMFWVWKKPVASISY